MMNQRSIDRASICAKCDQLNESKLVGWTCGPFGQRKEGVHCGCILGLKVPLKNQKCPQGKWNE